jgi:hypothetical protein
MVILAWILAFLPSSESVIQKMIFPIGLDTIGFSVILINPKQ